jgi:hypothetical protein
MVLAKPSDCLMMSTSSEKFGVGFFLWLFAAGVVSRCWR